MKRVHGDLNRMDELGRPRWRAAQLTRLDGAAERRVEVRACNLPFVVEGRRVHARRKSTQIRDRSVLPAEDVQDVVVAPHVIRRPQHLIARSQPPLPSKPMRSQV